MSDDKYNGIDRRTRFDQDHDLLLNINSKINNFIQVFEAHVKDKSTVLCDHENRLRFIEKAMWLGLGGLGLLQIFLKFYK